MPKIVAAGFASPPHVVPQELVKQAVAGLYGNLIPGMDVGRIIEVFDHSRIETRRFLMPLDWYGEPHTPSARHRVFVEKGLDLLAEASRRCLEAAGRRAEEISHIIFVSTTGLSTPTLDSYLINRLGMPPTTSRLPIWGLGCAAGAAGIARAFDFCLAHPGRRTLLVALELCSLTFMEKDLSKRNLVAMSLFADGCAAVLVAGDGTEDRGPQILATRSHLFPDSYRVMGWDMADEGMRLVLSPGLPDIVREDFRPVAESFLRSCDLRLSDVVHHIAHPGGAKVLDALRAALGLSPAELRLSEEVLREWGNISSVSVLIVLEKWLAGGGAGKPGYGLLSAFGPGFSAEMALLRA